MMARCHIFPRGSHYALLAFCAFCRSFFDIYNLSLLFVIFPKIPLLYFVDFVMSHRSKRGHDPPSGQTPGKPPSKQRPRGTSYSRNTLFQPELKPCTGEYFNNVLVTALIFT